MYIEKTEKNRLLILMFAVAAVFVLAFGGFSVEAEAADTDSDIQEMYRLYNPNSGEHFYTSSTTERDSLKSAGWNYEGVAWNAPKSSDTPVYRLYNPNAGDHHYTMSTTERDNLISIGWSYEGIGWYSADSNGNVLYRLYNPNAQSGSHHYTTSTTERDNLISLGWNYEGTAWYGEHTHQWADDFKYLRRIGYKSYWKCFCGLIWYDIDDLDEHFKTSDICGSNSLHTASIFANQFYDSSDDCPDGYTYMYFGQKCTICGAIKDHYYEYEYELLPVVGWETSNGYTTAVMASETVDSFDECPNGFIFISTTGKCVICGEEISY